MLKIKPWLQILAALALALVVGFLINQTCATARDPKVVLNSTGGIIVTILGNIGSLFLQALKMVITPLIFSSVVVGIAGIGKAEGFARMGLKTVGYYLLSSLLAILVGLTLVNLVKPGLVDGQPNQMIRDAIHADSSNYAAQVEQSALGQSTSPLAGIGEMFRSMIPSNIFQVFSDNNQMLALIFVSVLVAFGLLFVGESARNTLLQFFRSLNELTILITGWIMTLAPLGVFGLVAKTVALTGFATFGLLGKYFLVVVIGLLIHAFVTIPLFLRIFGRVSQPYRIFHAMRQPLLTAFCTASSSATLPVSMKALQEEAKVSQRVTSFALPLGATGNMDGTALYECVAVIFVSQVLGVELSSVQQFLIVALSLLTSIGVAGIPSASLVAITIIVNNVGIPNAEAVIGFLLAVDRILDMTRTAVNVLSDSCGAIIIARSEGESHVLLHTDKAVSTKP